MSHDASLLIRMLRSAVVKSQVRSCGKHDRQLAARNTSAITLQIPGLSKYAIGMFPDRRLEMAGILTPWRRPSLVGAMPGRSDWLNGLPRSAGPRRTMKTMFEFTDLG